MKFKVINFSSFFKILLSTCLFLGALNITKGNNVRISSATRMGPNSDIIEFTLSWENSWMVNGVPKNHDAVWVFIKFRECGVTIDEWSHALLSTNMGDHTFGANTTYATPILSTNRFGTGSGHNTGVMIRRNTVGIGDITTQTIQLQIIGSSNGIVMDPTLEYDIKVFGIEMVNIPEGKFFAGDGMSNYALWQVGSIPPQPHLIESESSFATYDYSTSYQHTLSDSFPKGYAPFYIMKYEITHGQYVDFLNTITSLQQVNRAYIYNYYRHDIQYDGLLYFTNSVDRVLNYISFHDLMAYLDWAALRPITELEYEKACRGALNFVQGEWAWGSGALTDLKEIKLIDGATPGIEVPLDSSNAHIYISQYTITGGQFSTGGGTYANQGPVAAGIFARQTHQQTRKGTGATYYGVMEMSGNVWEQCIQINTANASNNPSPFTGIWGDGQLTNIGFHNVIKWPNAGYFIPKGGSWVSNADRARVSDRYARAKTDYTTRAYDIGGRGAR